MCGTIMSSTPSSRRRTTPCFVCIESDGIVGNFDARQQWRGAARSDRSRRSPLAGEGFGEAHAVAAGLAHVGVVQESKAHGFADSWWWKSRNLHVLKHFAVRVSRVPRPHDSLPDGRVIEVRSSGVRVCGLHVGHGGLGADAEHVHEVDRVGGVGGLVEDAVAAQLRRGEPEPLEDGVHDAVGVGRECRIGGGDLADEQVWVGGSPPQPSTFVQPRAGQGVGKFVEVDGGGGCLGERAADRRAG
jgi:hypothetical protein